ncbi:MAG: DMT family transporter [Roseobacter sp.]
MDNKYTVPIATAVVICTGVLWGFYWLPVRELTRFGMTGPWGTFAITFSASILMLPFAICLRKQFSKASSIAIASATIGGAAFALYSIGFVYGRVSIIILLFFLTPVWSTLIGRFIMGWQTPNMRIWAIIVGVSGLGVMLSADGTAPFPRNAGEWMALSSGILWSVATTGIKAEANLKPIAATFVFACGASALSLIFALLLEPMPDAPIIGPVLSLAFSTGGLWWCLSMLALMWAALKLEPARVGILLMAEVLVGALTSAIWAGEHLSKLELIGGALVICAGVLEVWPLKKDPITLRVKNGTAI